MSKYLVVVESPTKARTICAILGKDYDVTSSMGHIIDLPAKKLSVDTENNFVPDYRVIPGKEKILNDLKKKTKKCDTIYLATDPDREGEAIGWHIRQKLYEEGKTFYRVVFHEITEEALKEAFASPGEFDEHKVDAQTARRVLDRVVGYNLSPLLWKKIVRGLSAGRVQSVALKFIVEREKEIAKFVSQTTYGVVAKFECGGLIVEAKLDKFKDKKGVFLTKEAALNCIEELKKEEFTVSNISKRKLKRKPLPPFTTSLLQQDAFNKLRFSSQKTMLVAQHLYEGIDVKGEQVGLITYMRTDSFHVAPKAKAAVKEFIEKNYGKEYLPEKDYAYKEKKGAQLAHEAIRPTSVLRNPREIEDSLNSDEAKLYELIWRRFISAFMKESVSEHTKATITSDSSSFLAEGKRLEFEGFLKVLGRSDEGKELPVLKKGDCFKLVELAPSEHTTKPPARFNDASLVRLLEEKGIGRPSTYAPTIYTLVKRDYIRKEKGAFFATDLGFKVCNLLVEHFTEVMDENFTALIEEKLDKVEDGEIKWETVLQDFYPAFIKKVEAVKGTLTKEFEYADKTCPQCNKPLVIKWSRKGKFLSCSDFPKCRYAESITTEVACPECKKGKLIRRRNKRGQFFYGCSAFPECRFTSRDLPKESETKETEPKEPQENVPETGETVSES
ncbi:MAG: type I DNA topoisomerase [Candidatus Omnitrophica bacterium]|nr:type I DNA topoisomerase [Candidatus Omnitrophota bacterium]